MTPRHKYFSPLLLVIGAGCELLVAIRWTHAGYSAADQTLAWTTTALFIVSAITMWRAARARSTRAR